ncbi:cytochrome P450 [Chytriomyces sp. MP71]|nr:cytochrome P450 [Chytriomyces sp. MP71]
MRFVKDPEGLMREAIATHGNVFSMNLGGNHFYYLNAGGVSKQHLEEFWKKTNLRKSAVDTLSLQLFLPNAYESVGRSLHVQMLKSTFNATLDSQSVKMARIFPKVLQQVLAASSNNIVSDPKNLAYDMIANASCECFLGPELVSPAMIDYFKTLFDSLNEPGFRMFLPSWTFKYLYPFLPYRKFHAQIGALVNDTLEERFATYKNDPALLPDDGISHIVRLSRDRDEVLNMVMLLVLASMITTASALHNALYDLANHPLCAAHIREEMQRVGVDTETGGFTRKQFAEMPYLDAFVRESLLYSAPVVVTSRAVTVDFPTETGTVIPAGATVLVLGTEAHTLLHQDGKPVFAPERWIPSTASATQKYCTTTGPEFVLFGGGAFKCPGRFFSTLEIKSSLCVILGGFDIGFVDGKRHLEKEFNMANKIPAKDKDGKQVPLVFSPI